MKNGNSTKEPLKFYITHIKKLLSIYEKETDSFSKNQMTMPLIKALHELTSGLFYSSDNL